MLHGFPGKGWMDGGGRAQQSCLNHRSTLRGGKAVLGCKAGGLQSRARSWWRNLCSIEWAQIAFFPQKKSGHWECAGKADDVPSCSWMLFVPVSAVPLLPALLFIFFPFKGQKDSRDHLICLTVKHDPSTWLPSLTGRAAQCL